MYKKSISNIEWYYDNKIKAWCVRYNGVFLVGDTNSLHNFVALLENTNSFIKKYFDNPKKYNCVGIKYEK